AVSSGRASMATRLDVTSMVLALIVLAISRCRVGWMARSAVATRYQLGLVFQAAAEAFPPSAAPAVGPWAANRTFFSAGVRSCAKSFLTPDSVSLRKPSLFGRISAFKRAGSTLAPREPAD